jgi:microcystin-dependent protein
MLGRRIPDTKTQRKGDFMEAFIGTILLWPINFAPRGWMFCQGQLLPISQYTALFSLLGTTYGGNGQTTFGLPDLRSRVPVGAGQAPGLSNYQLGQTSGSENVTLTVNELPAHTHTASPNLTVAQQGISSITGEGSNSYATAASSTPDTSLAAPTIGGSIAVGPTGGNQPVSVIQPYQAMNYIICIEGIFPSRP